MLHTPSLVARLQTPSVGGAVIATDAHPLHALTLSSEISQR